MPSRFAGPLASLLLILVPVAAQGERAPDRQRSGIRAGRVSEEDRRFWAFLPLRDVTPPALEDPRWSGHPIDRFVRAAQQRHGVTPSDEAGRRTLFRRASFALTGLPPEPRSIDRFERATDGDPWHAVIDTMLASPSFGERWARHWLDVARFAESHGFEQDYDRPHAYHYRDYVIRAFNDDQPFNQFVAWQIAGDELAPADPLARMATGFLGAGVFPTQLTEKEFEKARYDELDDMVAAIGTGMLGISIECARCHDHKYDPIPSSDYYRMIATFATTIRSEVQLALDPAADAIARAAWEKQRAAFQGELDRYEREDLPDRLAAFLASDAAARAATEPGWEILRPTRFDTSGGATTETQDDDSVLVTGKNARFDTYTVVIDSPATSLTAVRIEALPDASMVRNGPGRAVNGNFCLTNLTVTAAPRTGDGSPIDVPLATAKATFSQRGLPVGAVIDGNRKSGWAVDPRFGKPHAGVFAFKAPVGFPGGTRLTLELDFQCNTGHNIGRPRFAVTGRPAPVPLRMDGPPPAVVAALETPRAPRTPEQHGALLKWFRNRDAGWRARDKKLRDLPAPASSASTVMICSEGHKPIAHHADGRGFPHFYDKVHVLDRGDPNAKGPVVQQGFPQVLVRDPAAAQRWLLPRPADATTSHRRAALARWLTDVDDGAGALLARVIVNRLWHLHFGTGIVATPNNFGSRGAPPTHPDLLEYLAGELVRNGWRLKPIHRLIMTSATWRQSDRVPDGADVPRVDRWFARYRPRRLEGEALRDAVLSVSGVLDPRMYGKGTLDEGNDRRSIYFMIKRSKLIPMMVTFDLPEPLTSQGRRTTTTVAPQALLLMNSPHIRRYAAAFARRVETARLGDPITEAYRRALGRAPTSTEHAAATTFLASQSRSYTEAGKPAPRSLALTDFCQVLFGLNEFAYVH